MSTLLWSLAKENPWPGLAVASLNLVVALSLVGLSLLLGVTISLLAVAARVRRSRGGADQAASPAAEGHFMTPALLLVRDCIIYSVNVWLIPVECAFNIIESELVRRGVQLYPAEQRTVRAT